MDAYITNVCGCRPPQNRQPHDSEMVACSPRLDALLQAVQPKAVLLLGSTAFRALTGGNAPITRMRGTEMETGWTWKGKRSIIPAIPTYHPAYLLRVADPKRKEEFIKDMKLASELAHGSRANTHSD